MITELGKLLIQWHVVMIKFYWITIRSKSIPSAEESLCNICIRGHNCKPKTSLYVFFFLFLFLFLVLTNFGHHGLPALCRDLSFNRLTGTIPQSMASLRNLEFMYYFFSIISYTIYTFLFSFLYFMLYDG